MWAAWVEKQKWAGCRELSSEVDEQWRHTRNCLRACKVLAQSRIWTTQQLCCSQGTLLLRYELSHRHCSLTVKEYTSLTSWLSVLHQKLLVHQTHPLLVNCRQLAGAQVEMESVPDDSVSCDQLISKISDAHLVQHLCRSQAVVSFTAAGQMAPVITKWNA
jgi:hypothetical protein